MKTKGQRMPFSQAVRSKTVPPLPHFFLHTTGHLADNNFPSLARKTTSAVWKIFMFMQDLKSLQVLTRKCHKELKVHFTPFLLYYQINHINFLSKNCAKPTTYNTKMMG